MKRTILKLLTKINPMVVVTKVTNIHQMKRTLFISYSFISSSGDVTVATRIVGGNAIFADHHNSNKNHYFYLLQTLNSKNTQNNNQCTNRRSAYLCPCFARLVENHELLQSQPLHVPPTEEHQSVQGQLTYPQHILE